MRSTCTRIIADMTRMAPMKNQRYQRLHQRVSASARCARDEAKQDSKKNF